MYLVHILLFFWSQLQQSSLLMRLQQGFLVVFSRRPFAKHSPSSTSSSRQATKLLFSRRLSTATGVNARARRRLARVVGAAGGCAGMLTLLNARPFFSPYWPAPSLLQWCRHSLLHCHCSTETLKNFCWLQYLLLKVDSCPRDPVTNSKTTNPYFFKEI